MNGGSFVIRKLLENSVNLSEVDTFEVSDLETASKNMKSEMYFIFQRFIYNINRRIY